MLESNINSSKCNKNELLYNRIYEKLLGGNEIINCMLSLTVSLTHTLIENMIIYSSSSFENLIKNILKKIYTIRVYTKTLDLEKCLSTINQFSEGIPFLIERSRTSVYIFFNPQIHHRIIKLIDERNNNIYPEGSTSFLRFSPINSSYINAPIVNINNIYPSSNYEEFVSVISEYKILRNIIARPMRYILCGSSQTGKTLFVKFLVGKNIFRRVLYTSYTLFNRENISKIIPNDLSINDLLYIDNFTTSDEENTAYLLCELSNLTSSVILVGDFNILCENLPEFQSYEFGLYSQNDIIGYLRFYNNMYLSTRFYCENFENLVDHIKICNISPGGLFSLYVKSRYNIEDIINNLKIYDPSNENTIKYSHDIDNELIINFVDNSDQRSELDSYPSDSKESSDTSDIKPEWVPDELYNLLLEGNKTKSEVFNDVLWGHFANGDDRLKGYILSKCLFVNKFIKRAIKLNDDDVISYFKRVCTFIDWSEYIIQTIEVGGFEMFKSILSAGEYNLHYSVKYILENYLEEYDIYLDEIFKYSKRLTRESIEEYRNKCRNENINKKLDNILRTYSPCKHVSDVNTIKHTSNSSSDVNTTSLPKGIPEEIYNLFEYHKFDKNTIVIYEHLSDACKRGDVNLYNYIFSNLPGTKFDEIINMAIERCDGYVLGVLISDHGYIQWKNYAISALKARDVCVFDMVLISSRNNPYNLDDVLKYCLDEYNLYRDRLDNILRYPSRISRELIEKNISLAKNSRYYTYSEEILTKLNKVLCFYPSIKHESNAKQPAKYTTSSSESVRYNPSKHAWEPTKHTPDNFIKNDPKVFLCGTHTLSSKEMFDLIYAKLSESVFNLDGNSIRCILSYDQTIPYEMMNRCIAQREYSIFEILIPFIKIINFWDECVYDVIRWGHPHALTKTICSSQMDLTDPAIYCIKNSLYNQLITIIDSDRISNIEECCKVAGARESIPMYILEKLSRK